MKHVLSKIKTAFGWGIMGCSDNFVFQKVVLFAGLLWFSVSSYLLPLFRFIIRYLFRAQEVSRSPKTDSSCSIIPPKEQNQTNSNYIEPETESDQRITPNASQINVLPQKNNIDQEPESETIESEDLGGNAFSEEEKSSEFTFTFKFQTYEEFSRAVAQDTDSVKLEASPSKYEFKGGEDFSTVVEEPEVLNVTVKEFHSPGNENEVLEDGFSSEEGFSRFVSKTASFHGEEAEDLTEEQSLDEKNDVDSDDSVPDLQFHTEMDYLGPDSDSESMDSSQEFSDTSHLMDSSSEPFLSDKEFEGAFELASDTENVQLHKLSFKRKPQACDEKKLQKSEDPNNCKKIPSGGDLEDSNGMETQWEHQELIEQLKMEVKKVRATGLPTILEESECPKTMMEDLKPWRIHEKFQHDNQTNNLHKFYKSYAERMRKFDILNYQKMYAIGFLQLKDPLESMSSKNSSNFRLFKRKKMECGPTMKFIKELHSDLETVYVGHLCLSWEFLHWQYEKALEIWESDPHLIRRYNEVAGEFQHFQVLVQRFMENEPFQGPRVHHYAKTRCVLRNLLQVPDIKEDGLKSGQKGSRGRGNDGIMGDTLVEIIEESIRIFWRFLQADKDSATVTNPPQIQLQDPSDADLWMDIQTTLQKKEKQLKEQSRTGNCILKRFQRHHSVDGSDQVLYFFSQVDMKLVSRVLNMSRATTDQLVWCRTKLSKINFVNRKIHVDPSFLLFPC